MHSDAYTHSPQHCNRLDRTEISLRHAVHRGVQACCVVQLLQLHLLAAIVLVASSVGMIRTLHRPPLQALLPAQPRVRHVQTMALLETPLGWMAD
jgi:hypothetical protein